MYNASLMHHTDIFATAVKAATNMVPVPHLPQHNIKTVQADDAFLPQRRQKVLGGQSDMVLCRHTQCHQPTTSGTETIPTESSNHELIEGMVSALGGVG